MDKIPAPQEIDKAKFAPDAVNLSTKFGLPQKVVFCKRCVISNQRPNSAVEYQHTKESKKETIHFDAEGVCDACRFAEQKARHHRLGGARTPAARSARSHPQQ